MRLIDADQLKGLILKERDAIPKTISERYGFGIGRPNNHGDSMRGGIRKALRCMEQCPTIKVETVNHGRWIKNSIKNPAFVICSECETVWYNAHNYCPNCGANMRGNTDE